MLKIPVSVIIPCFNCAETIERCVNSILNQSFLPEEIIIVDDCSTDNTVELIRALQLKNHSLMKLLILTENVGPGIARNFGWDSASCEYIAFLDSDDTWHPKKLEIQYKFMSKYLDVDLSGHNCIYSKNTISLECGIFEALNFMIINRYSLLFKNPFSTPTVMLRKSLPHRFSKNSRYAEDIFLWQRLAFANFKVARINSTLAYVHKPFYGVSGMSAKLWEMEKGELNNLFNLKSKNIIGWLIFALAVIFSLVKYFRRLLLVKFL